MDDTRAARATDRLYVVRNCWKRGIPLCVWAWKMVCALRFPIDKNYGFQNKIYLLFIRNRSKLIRGGKNIDIWWHVTRGTESHGKGFIENEWEYKRRDRTAICKRSTSGRGKWEKRTVFRGELALFITVINSFGVVLMLYSGAEFPQSPVYICIFRGGTGHFTGYLDVYLPGSTDLKSDDHAQKFVPAYLFSFVVGFAFSELWICMSVDWYSPKSLLDFAYCILLSVICCCALALRFLTAVDCPIIPTDLFPRIITDYRRARYSRVKIGYDDASACVWQQFLPAAFGTFRWTWHWDSAGSI